MKYASLAAIVALSVVFAGSLFAANPDEFVVFNYYHVDGSGSSVINMPGRLYVPATYNPAQKYPLVLFLHGRGEGGTNNTSQVNGNMDNLFAAAKARGFFLLCPQSGDGWWQSYKVDTAMKMISLVAESYSIDMRRIYVTGLSAGGGGSWQAIGDYMETFAAAVPIVASGGYSATRLPGKPVWSYEARDDQFLTTGRNMVNAIRAADGGKPALTFPLNNSTSNPYYNNGSPYYADGSTIYSENNQCYSEYASGGHTTATWGRAYAESWMYDWLLDKSNQPHGQRTGETVLMDLGEVAQTAADAQGRWWNSAALYRDEVTLGPEIPYCKTTAGVRTTVILSCTASFYGRVLRGTTAGDYPANVSQDGWISRTATPGALLIKGLAPNGQYRIAIFASDTDSDGTYGRVSRYSINGVSRDLNVVNNVNSKAVFESVTASAAGQIAITVGSAGTTRYPEIGAIELTAIQGVTVLGDFNWDGAVNIADYTTWADHFNQSDAALAPGSSNGDGVIDIADYTTWADNFNKTVFAADLPEVVEASQGAAPAVQASADEHHTAAPAARTIRLQARQALKLRHAAARAK